MSTVITPPAESTPPPPVAATPAVPVAPVTPAVETPTEPPSMTIAERKAQINAEYARKNGIDLTKFKGAAITSAKPAETPAVTTVAPVTPVAATPVTEPPKKKKSGVARFKAKIERLTEEVERLKAGSGTPPTTPAPTVTTKTEEIAVEPKREDFATTEEWFTAVRKFDKEQHTLELQKATKTATEAQQTEEFNVIITDFNKRLAEAKEKHDDWDDVMEEVNVPLSPGLGGVLMSADPEILYELAKAPKEARRLNQLSEIAIVAVGNSDDVTSVLRHLSKNPQVIEDLNELSATKAQKFIGKIEAEIEGKKTTTPPVTTQQTSPTGVPATQPQAVPGVSATREPAPRSRSAVPPVIDGAAPSAVDYRDNTEMSLADRKRLYMSDPKHQRR